MAGERIVCLSEKMLPFGSRRSVICGLRPILKTVAARRGFPAVAAAFALIVVGLPGLSDSAASTAGTAPGSGSEADLPIYLIRRVVILNAPPVGIDNTHVQKRIAVERANLEQKRHRKRKRLFAPEPAVKPARRRPPILPPAAAQKPKEAKEPDVVPPEQRTAIAQALLTDALTDRLLDRLKVTTVPDAEVKAALSELHLTAREAASREGALQLCNRLQAQAVLAPQVTGVIVRDGITRDCVIRATIRIPGVLFKEAPPAGRAMKPPSANAAPQQTLPSQLMIAGYAQVDRVIFSSLYVQPQSAVIRLAAQQTAALAVHTMITGQTAPFMRPGDRLGMAPVLSPTQADLLVFTAQGRRVMPNAVKDLPSDVSDRFKPQLLPLLPEQIRARSTRSGSAAHAEANRAANTIGQPLWINADTPNIEQARSLAASLGVDYLLMAHVTDIELEEGPPPTDTPAIVPATNLSGSPADRRKPSTPDREREAKAEAVSVLVRASDGAVLWRAHASATMSALLSGQADPSTWPTDQRIAGAAVRFALVDLERQLTHYRGAFER